MAVRVRFPLRVQRCPTSYRSRAYLLLVSVTRSVGGGVAELSALVECAELLRNFGISFEKYLLKQVWHLFSINLPNLRFSAHFPCLLCSNLLRPFDSQWCCWEYEFFSFPLSVLRFLFACSAQTCCDRSIPAPSTNKKSSLYRRTLLLSLLAFGFAGFAVALLAVFIDFATNAQNQ